MMSEQTVAKAINHLDDALTPQDRELLGSIAGKHFSIDRYFEQYRDTLELEDVERHHDVKQRLIDHYGEIGKIMQEYLAHENRILVYPFSMPKSDHSEVSRVIAKLRNVNTQNAEFVYYIQRAYELLFRLIFVYKDVPERTYFTIPTPVDNPKQQIAVHKIPSIDDAIDKTVVCVMLRAALLPSMIISKEIEEYSSNGYITPFALFDIKRTHQSHGTSYSLDVDCSYFNKEELMDKDLIFADPINATSGSFITVLEFLESHDIRPRNIYFVNVISSLRGALRVVRNRGSVYHYTLWMDPVLNEANFILPGLGDAGDRINGQDPPNRKRAIIELLADYGSTIADLYKNQIRAIERIVLKNG